MKMIIAVIQDKDASRLVERLIDDNFRATKLATTGGFLKSGNTTLLIGTENPRVDACLQIIKDNSGSREQIDAPVTQLGIDASFPPVKLEVGGATVFVMPIEKYVQF
jgi:uncharacterized protein YaaQ